MGIGKDKSSSTDAADLRRHAEKQLHTKTAELHPRLSKESAQKLVHELEVHRIELEMQNAELRQARDEAEMRLENYTDLYDFAPIGYFTLDRDGDIISVNLRGVGLLGVERSRLIGRRFSLLVTEEYRPAFTGFLHKIFTGRSRETCETALMNNDNMPLFVQIEAMTDASGQECRIAFFDITPRKLHDELIKSYIEKLSALNESLDRFNRASVGRELRMIELKKEINELCAESGRQPRYQLDFDKEPKIGQNEVAPAY